MVYAAIHSAPFNERSFLNLLSFLNAANSIKEKLSGPSCLAIDRLRSTPAGLLAVIASFLFLGLGTIVALTREFWHHQEHKSKKE